MRYGKEYKPTIWKVFKSNEILGNTGSIGFEFNIRTSRENYYNSDKTGIYFCTEYITLYLKTKSNEYNLSFEVSLEKDNKGFFTVPTSDLSVFISDNEFEPYEHVDKSCMIGFEGQRWQAINIKNYSEQSETLKVYEKWKPFNVIVYCKNNPELENQEEDFEVDFNVYTFSVNIKIHTETIFMSDQCYNEIKYRNNKVLVDEWEKLNKRVSRITFVITNSINNSTIEYVKDELIPYDKTPEYLSELKDMLEEIRK